MNLTGADFMLQVAAEHDIDVCFANPGTTEMPVIAALDRQSDIKTIPCLFEGVCSGAADGYARMQGKPALTLTHLGPGFSNSLANLHNARRAKSPVVNLIGEHASWHRGRNSPLESDLMTLAHFSSDWAMLSDSNVGKNIAQAIAASKQGAGRISSLVVPSNYWWQNSEEIKGTFNSPDTRATSSLEAKELDVDAIEQVAKTISKHSNVALLLGGISLKDRGLEIASNLQHTLGWTLLSETFPSHARLGRGYPALLRLPYLPDEARQLLRQFSHVIVAGAAPLVASFGYPDDQKWENASNLLPDGVQRLDIECEEHMVVDGLETLASFLGVEPIHRYRHTPRPQRPSGPITPASLVSALVYAQPQDAIVVDESLTSGATYYSQANSAAPFSYLTLTGGSIGFGPPCALGAAVAYPSRQVINFQSDGSAMYTLQALWSQARLGLNVTTIICSNRKYNILQMEAYRFRSLKTMEPGDATQKTTVLSDPNIDWIKLANGMGIPAKRLDTAKELAIEIRQAVREPGPSLIEVQL